METYYRHFKGGIYKLLHIAKDSETQEDIVVYQAMYGGRQIWVCPKEIFFGTTYVNGIEVKRFEEILDQDKLNLSAISVKFKKLHPDAIMPTKAHDSDFCYDCYAVSCEEVAPDVFKYGLGFALQYPGEGNAAHTFGFTIRPRSSVWKTGMVLSNSIGTVDEGYTGEISAVFYHVMPDMPRYRVGDKVCQIHLDSTIALDFVAVSELKETDRGDNGYGSSDK